MRDMSEQDRADLGPMLVIAAGFALGIAWGIFGEKALGIVLVVPLAAAGILVQIVDASRGYRQWADRGGDYGAY